MITLGIRARPDDVTFVIYDSDANALVNVETIRIPKALSTPESLKYVRNSLLDTLNAYGVERAGIRIVESNSKQKNARRIEIEGVIQESFASSELKSYYCGQISSISARIGIQRTEFKPLVDGSSDYDRVENWQDLTKEEREAVLTALGAVHA